MSVGPGPNPPGSDVRRRTNAPLVAEYADYFQDEALEALAKATNVVGSRSTGRWEAIKHLRVYFLRKAFDQSPQPQLPKIPTAYRRTFAAGRLSALWEELGSDSTAWHLEFDWFGSKELNWWGAGIDGNTLQEDRAGQLLNFLEGASELPGVTSAPRDPSTWTWPESRPIGHSPLELLETSPTPGNRPANVRFRWEWEDGAGTVGFSRPANSSLDESVFLITTPNPKRRDW